MFLDRVIFAFYKLSQFVIIIRKKNVKRGNSYKCKKKCQLT